MREPNASSLLSVLSDSRSIDGSAACVVIAHPDDESIGCGGQLARLPGVSVVLVTDGAPRNLVDARACGFATAAAYACARAAEFREAMRLVGVTDTAMVSLGIPDQSAARHLALLTCRLVEIFSARSIRIAITHAYEGGHPDHDAAAFAVHAARNLLARGGHLLEIIEMPLYRLGHEGMLVQSFAPSRDGGPEIRLQLSAPAQQQKQQLLDVYRTQRSMLSAFSLDAEPFRLAGQYDFACLPNAGRVLYERHDWGLTGTQWEALVQESSRQLSLAG
jgi:LmbE family N-acetylglucosaminyl deacetylase